VVHLTARPLTGGGSWDGVSENWLTLSADAIAKLSPSHSAKPGDKWRVDAKALRPILLYMYPVTENNDPKTNRIDAADVEGKLLPDGATVRLDGRLRMRHSFYPLRPDDSAVEAKFVGLVEFSKDGGIKRFRLATASAKYGGGTFAVCVESAN
jgi:hypothetical protein